MLLLKGAFALLAIFLCSYSLATDALILISPDRAGPVVDENSYVHGEWILWPPADRPLGENRLLSLLTGIDWAGTGNELVFTYQNGRYLSTGFKDLAKRGYFQARDRIVQVPSAAIGPTGGFASSSVVLLALDGRSPQVVPLTSNQDWSNGVVIAEAESWDRVAAIAAKASGRVLVAEYPPPPGQRWSRYWLRGSGWRNALPDWSPYKVPGLIPASQAGNLLLNPNQFTWVENDSANWGGANRWLSFYAHTAPLVFAILGFFVVFFAGCTVYLISREEHARFGGTAVKYLTLIPATVLFAGHLTRVLGFSGTAIWYLFAFLSLVFVSQTLGAVCRRLFPGAHGMLGIAITGFAITAASAPLWSLYSNVLGPNQLPLSPEAVGSLVAYLTGICAFARGGGSALWLARLVAAGTLVWGVTQNPWWISGQWPFVALPIVCWLAGSRLFRLWMLPMLALLPLADGKVIRGGFVWAPGNLFPAFSQANAVNLARHAEFLVSFSFLCTAVLGCAMAVFVERYFFHEIRRTLLRDSRTKALFFASYACGAMGLFQPLMLYPALTCFLGGAFVLLGDTASAV
ncbi:MAG: hypothetical protein ACHQ50_15220 [Fimbriimonadales bacterium]